MKAYFIYIFILFYIINKKKGLFSFYLHNMNKKKMRAISVTMDSRID